MTLREMVRMGMSQQQRERMQYQRLKTSLKK